MALQLEREPIVLVQHELWADGELERFVRKVRKIQHCIVGLLCIVAIGLCICPSCASSWKCVANTNTTTNTNLNVESESISSILINTVTNNNIDNLTFCINPKYEEQNMTHVTYTLQDVFSNVSLSRDLQ